MHPPIEAHLDTKFGISTADTIWMLLGLAIPRSSSRHLDRRGAADSGNRVLSLPLPLLGLILPSTTRYLMSYQPFVWIFFCMGMVAIAGRFPLDGAVVRNPTAVAGIAIVVLATAVGIQYRELQGLLQSVRSQYRCLQRRDMCRMSQ